MRQDLKVPTQSVGVQLHLAGRGMRRLELYVADEQPVAPALVRLLEGEADFLPAHDVDANVWTVVRRSAVVMAVLPAAELELFDHAQPVRIDVGQAEPLEG